MRNIVIIGNGFDLAHNLPTSYGQFIDNLVLNELDNKKSRLLTKFVSRSIGEIAGKGSNGAKVHYTSIDGKPHSFNTHNYFLADLLKNKIKEEGNWSDIEGFYFEKLKALENNNDLNKLQEDFEDIKQRLIKYLKSINVKAIPDNNIKHFFGHNYFKNTNSDNNLIIDFNYSDTLYNLYRSHLQNFTINKVHGELTDLDTDKIIFGHDISFEEYNRSMKVENQNYFRNIKRVNYKTYSNFEILSEFLSRDGDFNVFVLGHSCSVSDSQILQSILTDKSLNKVSIFYFREVQFYKDQRFNIDFIMNGTGLNIDNKIFGANSTVIMPQYNDIEFTQKDFKNNLDKMFKKESFVKDYYFGV